MLFTRGQLFGVVRPVRSCNTTTPEVPFYQSSLSHASERRFNPVSLLGTAYSMRLIIQPVGKPALHRCVPFLGKNHFTTSLIPAFVCPSTSEGHLLHQGRESCNSHFYSWFIRTGGDRELCPNCCSPWLLPSQLQGG